MRDVIVCVRICLEVVSLLVSSPCNKSQLSLVMKLLGGDLWQFSSFWRICLQADKGSAEKASPWICCFSSAYVKSSKESIYQSGVFWGGMSWTCTVIFGGDIFSYPWAMPGILIIQPCFWTQYYISLSS